MSFYKLKSNGFFVHMKTQTRKSMAHAGTLEKKEVHPVYNMRFALVCMSSLLFSSSYNMLVPELPAYLSSLGGAEYKGLIIALFTLTAGISRPFSGKITDALGRVPVMVVGTLVCVICGLFYPLLGTVSGFLFLRLLHGFSTGFKPTATSAYVADIVPRKRWGEALGFQGLCYGTGFALGPALGSYIKLHFSYDVLFYGSSVMALLALFTIMNMKETLKDKKPFSWSILMVTRKDIIAPQVLPAGIVTFLAYAAMGVILTLIPDWSDHLGIVNKGLFFIVMTIASLSMRFIAGKASDRYGRERVICSGLVFLVFSLLVIGYSESVPTFLTGAAMYGLATGMMSPAINAWTVDLSDPQERGKGVSTMFIALEAGIGLGALFSGTFYQDVISRIPIIMYVTAGVSFTALIYMFFRKKTTTSNQ